MASTISRLIRSVVGADRPLHNMDGGQRSVTNQRPFLATVFAAVLITVFVDPAAVLDTAFVAGVVLAVCSTLPSRLLSWEQHQDFLYWITPMLQFAAIAGMRLGAVESMTGLSLIALFPVIWLAWFAARPRLVHIVNTCAVLIILWLPLFLDDGPMTLRSMGSLAVVAVVMLVISLFTDNVSRSIDRQREELLAKEAQLAATEREQRKLAEQFNTVAEIVPAGLVVVDAAGNDIFMNRLQKTFHQLGVPRDNPDPREDELLVFEADKKTPVPADSRPVRRAINGDYPQGQLIWVGDTKGQRRALSVSGRPMLSDQGVHTGSVVVFNDVTPLVKALEAKDEFLAGVTHELRTPLTSILGYTDLLLDSTEASQETAEIAANLRVIERNASRLLHMVSALLETSTGIRLDRRSADLCAIARSCLDSARPRAHHADIALIDRTEPSCWGNVDPNRIHQVLDNLVTNAIKYSDPGGTVTVEAWSETDGVNLRVSDTGHGISAADQEQIFERFFRTESVRGSATPGLGLGLAITKNIVHAHGGTIDVHSVPGRGTSFLIALPGPSPSASTAPSPLE